MNKAPERIILGSGYIHLATFRKGQQIPDPEKFCTDENRYSYIKNGATLEYTNEVQEVTDDMGKVSKTIITSEAVSLKAGLMTLIGDTIEKLCDTARVAVSEDGKYRRTKIGGVGNRKGAKYVICFHHVDPEDGDIWVMIVGQNQAGFTLSFAPSDATVVDAEFKAMPNLDDEGTLVNYVEEILSDEPDPDEQVIAPSVATVPVDATPTGYGKTAAEIMGSDVKLLEGGHVVGTFPYVGDFTGFSGNADEQKGNFFFLKLGSDYTGKEITVQRTSGSGGKSKKSSDLDWVLRLTDGRDTVYKITADSVPELTIDFAGATVNSGV